MPALGVLVAGAAWLVTGLAAAVNVLGGYTFMLAPAAFCIWFGVWRGGGLLSLGFLLLILIGAYVLSNCEMSGPLSGLLVALCVVSSFLLTRCALKRSRHTYVCRTPAPNSWDGLAWNAGR